MDFKQLEAFVQVVRLGSFSKAAKALYLTQPTVSAHVSGLEQELGTSLLRRTSQGALPTREGKILCGYAQEMLALRERAVSECGVPREMKGTLEIASSTVPHQHLLPELMSRFRELHPGASFHVISGDSSQVVDSLLAGRAELGLTGTTTPTELCLYTSFAQDSLVVITPNTEPYRSLQAFGIAQLRQFPFILREPGSGTRKETEEFLRQKGLGLEELKIAAQLDDPDAVKNSVGQGLGVSILSELSAADLARLGKILVFPLEGEPILRRLYVVRRAKGALSPLAAEFHRFVLEGR